jgi:hypothetical protein
MIGYALALLMGGVAGVRAMTALCTRLQPIGFTGADQSRLNPVECIRMPRQLW